MTTFVLVPGFWLGGWAWRETADVLRAAGHIVYAVTLTGLGERVHLGGPQVDLETHIADVVNLLRYEDLSGVTLVGHSYAAQVITGAADRSPERIARLIYVDTWPLPEGVALADLNSDEDRAAQERVVAEQGAGWALPLPPWEQLDQGNDLRGLGEAERRHMRERATPQPYGTARQGLRLSNPARAALPRTVIWCSFTVEEVRAMMTEYPAFSVLTEPSWEFVELPTGHWPMFSRPRDLAETLLSI